MIILMGWMSREKEVEGYSGKNTMKRLIFHLIFAQCDQNKEFFQIYFPSVPRNL
jgi:hypothetical protein